MRLGGWTEGVPPKVPFPTRLFRRDGMNVIYSIEDHGGSTVRHASVSRQDKYPTWDEIKLVRHCFFEDNQYVAQFLPPKEDYINVHKNCFHLWAKEDGTDWT